MQENVGGADRTVRAVGGPLLVLAALGPLGARRGSWLGLGTLVTGVLVTESAVTRVCPVNRALGVDTRGSG
jgi:hypothetical protein